MKTHLASIAGVLAIVSMTGASAQDPAGKTDWREQYAYTLGVQAYVFGFPYVYLPSLRADWVTRPKAANDITPYAPINHFSHVRNFREVFGCRRSWKGVAIGSLPALPTPTLPGVWKRRKMCWTKGFGKSSVGSHENV